MSDPLAEEQRIMRLVEKARRENGRRAAIEMLARYIEASWDSDRTIKAAVVVRLLVLLSVEVVRS